MMNCIFKIGSDEDQVVHIPFLGHIHYSPPISSSVPTRETPVPAAAAEVDGTCDALLPEERVVPSATSLKAAARLLHRMMSMAETIPRMRAHGIPTDSAITRVLLEPDSPPLSPDVGPLVSGSVVVVSGCVVAPLLITVGSLDPEESWELEFDEEGAGGGPFEVDGDIGLKRVCQ